MSFPDDPLPLGYTSQWIDLGIVSHADIRRDEQECRAGDDPHAEHYRWRAFSRFLSAQPTLSPILAQHLYSLGATDPDISMGRLHHGRRLAPCRLSCRASPVRAHFRALPSATHRRSTLPPRCTQRLTTGGDEPCCLSHSGNRFPFRREKARLNLPSSSSFEPRCRWSVSRDFQISRKLYQFFILYPGSRPSGN